MLLCFPAQVSGVYVPQSTLSVCVLSVGQYGKRHAVGRVLFPLEGELAGAGRVLWRDLETEDDTQVPGCNVYSSAVLENKFNMLVFEYFHCM